MQAPFFGPKARQERQRILGQRPIYKPAQGNALGHRFNMIPSPNGAIKASSGQRPIYRPAQGSALGHRFNMIPSPNGAIQTSVGTSRAPRVRRVVTVCAICAALSGLGGVAAMKPRALPWAGLWLHLWCAEGGRIFGAGRSGDGRWSQCEGNRPHLWCWENTFCLKAAPSGFSDRLFRDSSPRRSGAVDP